jgi:hypothetical protein
MQLTGYSHYDSIEEHAECARRYKQLNDKSEELKARFSDLRYFDNMLIYALKFVCMRLIQT